ncbi:MAG: nucleotide exchange factor GrpE [Cyanobacteria bacterium P01_F01_bin.13]
MSQSPRDRIAQRRQLQKQQAQIFLELLPVLDDLDRACNHWQQAQQQSQQTSAAAKSDSVPWWRQVLSWNTAPTVNQPTELNAMVKSAFDGVSLIRQSLLDVLERQTVTPIETVGQPFDPQHMNAMGREASPDASPNTVIKEILKGYRWQDRVLREAQVIVADVADSDLSNS